MFSESNLPLDLVFLWKRVDTQKNGATPEGCNSLTKLAIHILSVITNSAGCERSFSIFGNIHTKKRNKLDTDTVHKAGILKTDIMRRNIASGLMPKRKKRKFGDLDITEEPVNEPSSAELIDTIVSDALGAQDEVDEDEEDNLPERITPAQPIPVSQSPCTRKIPLKDLFDYPDELSDDLKVGLFEFYWKAGIKNLDSELAAYESTVGEQEVEVGNGDDVDMADSTAPNNQTPLTTSS